MNNQSYEYRIIKEEINISLAIQMVNPANDFGTGVIPDYDPAETIVHYKVQVKGSLFFWHDIRTFKSLKKAIEFKNICETFADEIPKDGDEV